MPNRVIREGILSSERVEKIAEDPACEVFYRRLFSVVDDYGRFSGDPRIVRAALYPLRLDSQPEGKIRDHIGTCEEAGLLITYLMNEKPYLELSDFRQRLRRMVSKYPGPPTVRRRSSDSEARPESESESESEVESETEEEDEIELENTRKSNIAFEELWKAFPAKGRTKRPLAEAEYDALMQTAPNQEELHRQIIDAVTGKWHRSKLWSAGFVAGLGEFIRLHRWMEEPEPAVAAIPKIPGWDD
jgi:hypothetical protein